MNVKSMLLACVILAVLSSIGYAIDVVGCNTVISSSGYYALTQDINASNVTAPAASTGVGCINITGQNIVFDLGGHTIENSSLIFSYGIVLFGNTSNVTIMNGTLQNLTGVSGGGIYVAGASAEWYQFNSSIHNVTITNSSFGIVFGDDVMNFTVNSATIRNISNHSIFIGAGANNISIINSNLTNASYGVSVLGNIISGPTHNISIINTEISFMRVGFNTTQESALDTTPSVFNVTLNGVRFLNNTGYDIFVNASNVTYLTNVMFNHTNISGNFTNYAGFKSSGPVNSDAPLAYNLTYFVNITNISSIATNRPFVDLTFHYRASDLPAGANQDSLVMYYHQTAWAAVTSSALNTNALTVSATNVQTFRTTDTQYGLFLSGGSSASGDDDDDGDSDRSLQRRLDPAPFDYECRDGRLVIQTLADAQVHASQVCDPACGRAAGGLACEGEVYDAQADDDGEVTFGGNGYYYVTVEQSSDSDYRAQSDYDFCFASCSAQAISYQYDLDVDCQASKQLVVVLTDDAGNPVSGAEVFITTDDAMPEADQINPDAQPYGLTDAQGRAHVVDVESAGANILVRKDGITTNVGHQAFTSVASQCTRELDYDLDLLCPENRVQITVFDKDSGERLEGANVVFAVMPGTTDDNGEVEFDRPEETPYIYISMDGYQALSEDNLALGTCSSDDDDDGTNNGNGDGDGGSGDQLGDCQAVEIAAERPDAFVGDNVRVIVKCDSQPVANQEVVIIPPQGPSTRVTTDSAGGINLPLEFQGTYQVGIARAGEIVDRDNVVARLRPVDTPPRNDIFAFLGNDVVRASLLVLILGAALIGAYLYLRSTQQSGRRKK